MLSLLSVLRRSKNFTSNVAIRMPPSVPINHYLGVPKTNKIEPRSCSIIPCTQYSGVILACFEHSNLFKVNVPARLDTQLRAPRQDCWVGCGTHETYTHPPAGRPAIVPVKHRGRWTDSAGHRFNYELFNRNNFNIRYWSWNYRGCWHQTCPPIDPR